MEDDKIGKVEKLETRENRNQEELNTRHYTPWRFAKGLYTQCTYCVELATTRPRSIQEGSSASKQVITCCSHIYEWLITWACDLKPLRHRGVSPRSKHMRPIGSGLWSSEFLVIRTQSRLTLRMCVALSSVHLLTLRGLQMKQMLPLGKSHYVHSWLVNK